MFSFSWNKFVYQFLYHVRESQPVEWYGISDLYREWTLHSCENWWRSLQNAAFSVSGCRLEISKDLQGHPSVENRGRKQEGEKGQEWKPWRQAEAHVCLSAAPTSTEVICKNRLDCFATELHSSLVQDSEKLKEGIQVKSWTVFSFLPSLLFPLSFL